MRFDDTHWFTNRPKLGVDYMLVVDCAAGGVFKCETREEALKAIKDASHNGCGYMLRSEDIITKDKR